VPAARRWDPRWVSAALAVSVRAVVSWSAFATNPLVNTPRLDAAYYLAWAGDIAGGDLVGSAGTISGEPFFLNPLYAYVLAVLRLVAGAGPVPALVLNALLAGGTAALAAAAARRFSGGRAAWVAGVAVAFSAALVHLDTHVTVSGLAAFLTAGACYALSPPTGRARGPLAAGLWLGVGALARPVALLALPFAAWRHGRGLGGSWRRGCIVLAVFAACALPSFVRNWSVSGEPAVFTAANGHNLFLGNNPNARRLRAMYTNEFRFTPVEMHLDSKYRVAHELGREPTRGDVSSWYRARALEQLSVAPAASAAHYANKLRWFFSPAEPASSADMEFDRGLTPALRIGFVPSWLIAALAGMGVLLSLRRRDVLLGPGALALAHWGACTLAFPLSHYRSPAIPALAVLTGIGVAAVWQAARDGHRRTATAAVGAAALVAVAGAAGDQPGYLEHAKWINDAVAEIGRARGAADPEVHADAARAAADRALELEPGSLLAMQVRGDADLAAGDLAGARDWALRARSAFPWNPAPRQRLAEIEFDLGNRAESARIMDAVVAEYPWSESLARRRDELLALARD